MMMYFAFDVGMRDHMIDDSPIMNLDHILVEFAKPNITGNSNADLLVAIVVIR